MRHSCSISIALLLKSISWTAVKLVVALRLPLKGDSGLCGPKTSCHPVGEECRVDLGLRYTLIFEEARWTRDANDQNGKRQSI